MSFNPISGHNSTIDKSQSLARQPGVKVRPQTLNDINCHPWGQVLLGWFYQWLILLAAENEPDFNKLMAIQKIVIDVQVLEERLAMSLAAIHVKWLKLFLTQTKPKGLHGVSQKLIHLGHARRDAEVDGSVTDLYDESTNNFGINLCSNMLDWVQGEDVFAEGGTHLVGDLEHFSLANIGGLGNCSL